MGAEIFLLRGTRGEPGALLGVPPGSEVALFQTASSATLFTGRGTQRFLLDQFNEFMMFIIFFDCLLGS